VAVRSICFSGDVGFQALASWYGWAKDPIVQDDHSRMENIADDISIVFIYGSRSHMDNTPAHQILRRRGSINTRIEVRLKVHYASMDIRSIFRPFTMPHISSSWRNRICFIS
jgi:hypothetical protein